MSKIVFQGECWIWTGSKTKEGYGQVHIGGKRGPTVEAHIVSYRIYVGKVPSGLELDHGCRNRPCINPSHVEPVTHAENMARGIHAVKTHCVAGHEFNESNTYQYRGRRLCRLCAQRRLTEHKQRRLQNAA